MAYSSKRRVRVWLGDRETGSDWREENDVTGFIGRSAGEFKVPLLLATRHSSGGSHLLDYCIVKIVVFGVVGWTAPNYKPPEWSLSESSERQIDPFKYEVQCNGIVHARFKTQDQRRRWLAFMQGKRQTK
jgi:hypothetical protein